MDILTLLQAISERPRNFKTEQRLSIEKNKHISCYGLL
ncbi:hypothetical protein VO64_2241 [Pseudomonas synxantha]|uniref:Uncharacterized protein n=1 Tax=Pseudomonas synxantha TaxID=47883 RepID=A0AAU8TKH9_9PSED|nr:hypothetical protein VO64_2241 [Pseudomonas synxantha]